MSLNGYMQLAGLTCPLSIWDMAKVLEEEDIYVRKIMGSLYIHVWDREKAESALAKHTKGGSHEPPSTP